MMNIKKHMSSFAVTLIFVMSLAACTGNSSNQPLSESKSASYNQTMSSQSTAATQSTDSDEYTLTERIAWQGFSFMVDDDHWGVGKKFYEVPSRPTTWHDIDISTKDGSEEGYLRLYSATRGQTEDLVGTWEKGFKSLIDEDEPDKIDEWSKDGIDYEIGVIKYDNGTNEWLFIAYDPITTHGMALYLLLGDHWDYELQNKLIRDIVSNASYDDPNETTYDAFDSRERYYRQVNGESNMVGAANGAPDDNKTDSANQMTVPTEFTSALNKAKQYSDTMHMSKASLYDQLTSEYGENFTEEAAQYAVDNVTADWKANALAKAKQYSDTMHMSKASLYDQLTSEYGEKFASEEAQYAVDNVTADWKANALAKAKQYQDTMDMSPTAIYDQLVSDYGEQFTVEEAQYAINHL